jgi:hypothetical protein
VNRYTFVFHAYPGGTSMLENLSTHEQVRVCDLAAVGPQIECWLASLTRSADPAVRTERSADRSVSTSDTA